MAPSPGEADSRPISQEWDCSPGLSMRRGEWGEAAQWASRQGRADWRKRGLGKP